MTIPVDKKTNKFIALNIIFLTSPFFVAENKLDTITVRLINITRAMLIKGKRFAWKLNPPPIIFVIMEISDKSEYTGRHNGARGRKKSTSLNIKIGEFIEDLFITSINLFMLSTCLCASRASFSRFSSSL